MSGNESDRKEITVPAVLSQMVRVWDFIGSFLDAGKCPEKVRIQMRIAVDEILSNIARHSDIRKGDEVTVIVRSEESPRSVTVTFIDSSAAFDPLSAAEPDVTAPALKRKIGGLGLFMMKKMMDEVVYEYRDGKNVLMIRKNF